MKKDIFWEDRITPIKGLLKRYEDRVLLELTLKCPADCEFCYRKWKKEKNENYFIGFDDIDKVVDWVKRDKKIKEIIFSGGEPLLELELMIYAIKKFAKLEQIKIFRIHTRAPVIKPELVSDKLLSILNKDYKQIIYLSIHINSIKELTKKTEMVINKLRKSGVILYSQSVFLKGINDDIEILEKLFSRLVELGVRPYNIYQCNRIYGNDKFLVSLEKEIYLMTELRKKLSGLACPNFILDIPGNANKIPVPTLFWNVDLKKVKDFDGNIIDTFSI